MGSRRRITGFSLVAGLLTGAVALAPAMADAGPSAGGGRAGTPDPGAAVFALHSPDISPGTAIGLSHVYDHSGCNGGNLSPALSWSHAPAGTRSFALLVFDSDVPEGGFWHWAVFDIPATVKSLREGAGDVARSLLPRAAVQSRNDYGFLGYGGPCPPSGSTHHYHFRLYALRVAKLGLGASAMPEQVDDSVRADALAEAEIVAIYGQ
jgi:Raf kinase inhibitor-like YbhB/YbcL family protein